MPTRTPKDRLNAKKALVGFSVDGGTSWVQYESYLTKVLPSVGDITHELEYTLDGVGEIADDDTLPIVEIEIEQVLTDAVDGAWDFLYQIFTSTDRDLDIQWSQLAGASGDRQLTSVGGRLVSCQIPGYDVTASGSLKSTAKIVCTSVTRATI